MENPIVAPEVCNKTDKTVNLVSYVGMKEGHRAAGCLQWPKRRGAESGSKSQPLSEAKVDKICPFTTSTPVMTSTQSCHTQKAQAPPQPPCVAKARAVASLIGKKALVQSYLNGLAVTSLLEPGSQVNIISHAWKDEYLPDLSIHPVSEILGVEELRVIAANGGLIPYDGWVAITVNLPGNLDPNLSISVPFLISSYPMDRPLLMPVLASLLSNAISVPSQTAEALVNFIQTSKLVMQQGHVRTGTKDTIFPAGQVLAPIKHGCLYPISAV